MLLRLPLGPPESASQVAQHVDGGPPPQLGGGGVLQHCALKVVAVLAEWRANHRVAVIVMPRTRQLATMHAPADWESGWHGPPCPVEWTGPKLGRSVSTARRGAQPRTRRRPYRRSTPPDEVAGIPSVNSGARRAAALAPGPAGLEEHAVGKSTGREDPYPFVARPCDDCAPQANGMAAPAAALSLGVKSSNCRARSRRPTALSISQSSAVKSGVPCGPGWIPGVTAVARRRRPKTYAPATTRTNGTSARPDTNGQSKLFRRNVRLAIGTPSSAR